MEEQDNKMSPGPRQATDLLSQIKKPILPTAPPGFYKSLGFDIAIVILSVLAGIVLQQFLIGQIEFFWVLISSGVFMSLSVLGSLLTRNFGHRVLVVAVEALGFTLPFLGLPADLLAICFGVMFILFFWGEYLSREDAENSVEIRFFKVIQRPLSKTISAVILAAVILYLPTWSQSGSFVSQAAFDSVFNLTVGVTSGLYPEYKFNSNLGDFAKSIASGQLGKDAQFNLLPPAIKTSVLNDASGKILEGLSKTAGIQLNPKDTFASVMYDFLSKSLNDLKIKFGTTFIVIWALAIFLTVRGIGALFGYLIAGLAFILYHAMITLKIIHVKTENKPHEVVEFF